MRAFYDPAQSTHAPLFFLQRGVVRQNYESPARAEALLTGLHAADIAPELPPPIEDSVLERVHTPDYVAFLRTAWNDWSALDGHGPELVPNIHPAPEMLGAKPGGSVLSRLGFYTADTACPIGPATWIAARAAAAGAIAAADEAAAGRHAYALARPPGHHAYPARAGGHCYLNNAALAAERLRTKGAARVAVLDIDSHHGNGTQGAFWTRPDVLFVSVHGDPAGYYPWYAGFADERGAGAGEGATINLPLPAGTGNAGWLEAVFAGITAVQRFGADAVVLSLGFDASEHEPLRFLSVTDDAFAFAAQAIAAMHKPTAIVQEGGYNTDILGPLLARVLPAFS